MHFEYRLFVAIASILCLANACPIAFNRDVNGNSTNRQAVGDSPHLWPNGIVPYVIDNKYDAASKAIILDGIAEFGKYTCIKFVPRTTQSDYIIFTEHSSGLCWTGKWGERQLEVGRLGGVQYVSLIVAKNCLRKFNVMHELMHSLGFYHEQQRDDRDKYIKVFYDNIVEDQHQVSYGIRYTSTGAANNLETPYDYNSIMHYHAYSFPKDQSRPVMAAVDGCSRFGNEKQFSKVDVLRINRLYKCPAPYKPPPPKVTYDDVYDDNEYCPYWAQAGECTNNAGYMNVYCKKSCGIGSSDCPSCKDDNEYCPSWAAAGYCSSDPTYLSYMYNNCRKSCEIC
ncbi:hatching enzyme 1.2-like [Daphnia carinata]|uniref:hatching enzyme 1.2-like n=1 Tax=Daphnia carinata TaxID=120202 RepID=UPI00257C8299|nr:hatching enzyme 1.2-like [Daphnia carinata]